jgi:hypothetical protein
MDPLSHYVREVFPKKLRREIQCKSNDTSLNGTQRLGLILPTRTKEVCQYPCHYMQEGKHKEEQYGTWKKRLTEPSGAAANPEPNKRQRHQQLANLHVSPVHTDTAMSWGYFNNPCCSDDECHVMVESDSEEDEDGKNNESEEISGTIACNRELMMEDILHGYYVDDEYDVKDMEEDGEYSENLKWEYVSLLLNGCHHHLC